MSMQGLIDVALVSVLLIDLAMLAAGRLATCIRLLAAQAVILSVLPMAAEIAGGHGLGLHALLLLVTALGLKALLIPSVLLRVIRSAEIHREVEPFIGFTASMFLGAAMTAGSFALSSRLTLPGDPMSRLLLPVALSTLLVGMLILISRVKAITQVIGYLVMENGIYLFGLSLLHQMPLLVELGILLDVFVGVFVMSIVVHHIRRAFDHMDTHLLDEAPPAEPHVPAAADDNESAAVVSTGPDAGRWS